MGEDYRSWTPCEFNGHAFADDEDAPGWRVCTDCHERYEV